jgi:hypothetical protein
MLILTLTLLLKLPLPLVQTLPLAPSLHLVS